MSLPELTDDMVSIVARGRFTPTDVSPHALLEHGMIGNPEFEDTKYTMLVPNDMVEFEAGWLRCIARSNLLQLSTNTQDESERLRDVAVGLLQGPSTIDVASLGINRHVHFTVGSLDEWHAIGDAFVPKNRWTDVLNLPGTRVVTVWGVRPDNYAGRIQVQVEPSQQYPQAVYVATNDHFSLHRVEAQPTSRDDVPVAAETIELSDEKRPVALEILDNEWAGALRRTEAIIEHVSRQGGSQR